MIIPYITTDFQYNKFNKIYYTSAIVILFAKLGFDFAINRIKIQHLKLFIAVFINTAIMIIITVLINREDYNEYMYLAIFVYSFFYIIANIFIMKNLFEGSYKNYFYYKFFYGLILISSLFILLKLSYEIFYVFPIAGFLWMLLIYYNNWKDYKGDGSYTEFYKLGFAAFVVNAALGFAFIADKYIINHYFDLKIANSYTFAWGITSPMLYLGNIMEHTIYTAKDNEKRKKIKNAFTFLLFIVVLYSIATFSIVSYFPKVMPGNIDNELLKQILTVFLIIYAVYTVIQYPLNGILFKFINNSAQYHIARIYPLIFALFCIVLYIIFQIHNAKDYFLLIIICALYIFTLLSIKIFIVKKSISVVK